MQRTANSEEMAEQPGINEGAGTSGDFLDLEAECEGGSSDEDEDDDGQDMVDFIDDRNLANSSGENPLALLNRQQQDVDTLQVQFLKRKYYSSPQQNPECDLSPRLCAIQILSLIHI